jgi:hypothetical protein
MEELAQFEQDLAEALTIRGSEISDSLLTELKQCYVKMLSSYETLHNVLKKKGLIKADPYNYEERISELRIPSDEAFLDSEAAKEISIRTGQYEAQLTYLTNYYDFSLESLDLRRLKKLVQFTRYIDWQNFSDNSTQPTTRSVAEQVKKIKHGSDQLSASIVSDAQTQLSESSRKALAHLKKITAYQRECYKLEVRRDILPRAGLPAVVPAPDQAVKKVRALWQHAMPGRPFAQELVLEIFAENNPDGGAAARQALLDGIKAPIKRQQVKKKAGPDLAETLLEAARALASCSRPLEETAQKLKDNALILQSRKLSFGEVLRAVWQRFRGQDSGNHVYLVEYVDDKTGSRRSEEINFEEFVDTVSRRARVYTGILSRSGAAWTRLQALPEEELLQFVNKYIQETVVIIRRCESLDTMLRAEIDRDQRGRLRGINAELTALREHVQRARRKTHEYVAKYEEIQQLKRLGIETN